MANLNKVFLMGNLTADPELRYTPKGTAVTDIRLAINRYYAGDNSERQEETTFVDVTLWNRQAEVAGNLSQQGARRLCRRASSTGFLGRQGIRPEAHQAARDRRKHPALPPRRRFLRHGRRPPPAGRSPFQQLRTIPGPPELQSSPHALQSAAVQRLRRHGRRDSVLKPQESH